MYAIVAIHIAATRFIDRARDDERGVTAIEYALLAALIAVAIIAIIGLVGDELTGTFTRIRDELQGANNNP